MITYSDYEKIDIRVGKIIAVDDFPEAHKPAYKLTIDFGPEIGHKRSSAQVTINYEKQALKGRKVLAVVNFPEKQIGPFTSQVLVLGTSDDKGGIILADPGAESVIGAKLF